MVERPPKPIRSLREDDPELEEQIDTFIAALGERVDQLQDTEASGDLTGLERLANALAKESEELGYPALRGSALDVAIACSDPNPQTAHKAIVDLTELCQRIRRGHRSAA